MVKESTPPPAAAGAVPLHAKNVSKAILLCLAAAAAAPIGIAAASPYSGAPITIPATIEAERFDRGGEGVGYHDWTSSNWGGAFRNEGVDIRPSVDAPNDNWIVSYFDTGEWLAYTINVPATGNYDWGVQASSAYGQSAYHLEIDGQNVTGQVTVPYTWSWNSFSWVPAPRVWLTQGTHVLKVVVDLPYFDLDRIVIMAGPAATPQAVQSSAVDFSCSFNSLPDCSFWEQSKMPGRGSLTSISRDGGTALRLHTEPGDTDVVYSGAMERDDVYLARPGTADPDVYGQGADQWWAHSIYFPDDFMVPTTYQGYVVFDFHGSGNNGQANFHITFEPWNNPTQPGLLRFVGYGGAYSGDGRYDAVIGQVQKNVWYDFVYHVRWSAGSDGFMYAWVNGKLALAHEGPTLYSGQGVYLKLANYHSPVCNWYPGCVGDQASSIIHDRIIRGRTSQAVAIGPLQYVDY